jgi:hypothetical protein
MLTELSLLTHFASLLAVTTWSRIGPVR